MGKLTIRLAALYLWLIMALVGLSACAPPQFQAIPADDGTYTISMPGTPAESSGVSKAGIKVNLLAAGTAAGTFYFSTEDFPPGLIDASDPLGALAYRLTSLFRTLQVASPDSAEHHLIDYEDLPGAEFSLPCEGGSKQCRGRAFWVEPRFYILYVEYQNPSAALDGDIDTFFNSFHLTK